MSKTTKTHFDPAVRYVDSEKNPLYAIKAYIAMIGAAVSALLASGVLGAVDSDEPIIKILTIISVLATAVVTFKLPNAAVAAPQAPPSTDGFSPYDKDEDDVQEPYGAVEGEYDEEYGDEADTPLSFAEEDYQGKHEADDAPRRFPH